MKRRDFLYRIVCSLVNVSSSMEKMWFGFFKPLSLVPAVVSHALYLFSLISIKKMLSLVKRNVFR